jgi:hypothetical protein
MKRKTDFSINIFTKRFHQPPMFRRPAAAKKYFRYFLKSTLKNAIFIRKVWFNTPRLAAAHVRQRLQKMVVDPTDDKFPRPIEPLR